MCCRRPLLRDLLCDFDSGEHHLHGTGSSNAVDLYMERAPFKGVYKGDYKRLYEISSQHWKAKRR